MGIEVEILKGDLRRAVRPGEVEARLRADKGGAIKAILVAQIDTASGGVNDIAAISDARRAAGHDALLMVDAVASLGCMPFEIDKWGVDVAMAGSQKGLMMPPGLGFVAASDRAREAHKTLACARRIGTGPSVRATRTIRNMPGRRPSTCCSAFARRSICCSRKAWRTPSDATICWQRRRGARSRSGLKGRR